VIAGRVLDARPDALEHAMKTQVRPAPPGPLDLEALVGDIERGSHRIGEDYAAQIERLLEHAPLWVSVNQIGAAALVWALWGSAPGFLLAPWLLFMTGSCAVHLFLAGHFRRRPASDARLGTWLQVSGFMAAVLGLAWGVGGMIMLPEVATAQRTLYGAWVLLIAVLSIPPLAPVYRVYCLFLGGCGLPLALYTLGPHGVAGVAERLLPLIGIATLALVAHRFHRTGRDGLRAAAGVAQLARPITDESTALRRQLGALQGETRQAAARATALADAALNAVGEAVVAIEADATIAWLNPVAEVMSGWSRSQLQGKPWRDVLQLLDPDSRAPVPDPASRRPEAGGAARSKQHAILARRDGLEYAVEYVATPIVPAGRDAAGVVLVLRDVTERRALEARIEWQQRHDRLTGLLNRTELERRIGDAVASARSDRRRHALCCFDLDRFSLVNDTWGVSAGDALISKIAEALSGRVREPDVLARIGGDEFALLLLDCTAEKARMVAEGMRNVVRSVQLKWHGDKPAASATVGVIEIARDAPDPEALLEAAHRVAAGAKAHGRDRVQVSDPDVDFIARRHAEQRWLRAIRHAIDGGGFQLLHQPIQPLAASDAGPAGELSARLLSADAGMIFPDRFLQAAERHDFIAEVERWLIKAATDALRLGHPVLRRYEWLRVKVSGQSVNDEDFTACVHSWMKEDPSIARRLCFALTGTRMLADLDKARRFIALMKDAGCAIALDDFGLGLGPFDSLCKLDVDFLGIEADFVRQAGDSALAYEIVVCVNRVAHSLGIRTIAAGVADRTQAELLARLGADYAQGSYLGEPWPLELAR
jgi:diguanylate cyclase (GGDEF)-like protein/PAS domain S-box-containing protein